MTWKCSNCGHELNEDSRSTCRNCGKKTGPSNPKPDKPKPESNKKEIEIPSYAKSGTMLAVGLIIFLILFYISPLPKAITFVLTLWEKSLLATLPENVVRFIIDYFIYWLIAVIVAIAAIMMMLQKPNLSLLFGYLGMNFIIIDILFIFSLVFWYAAINYGVLDTYLCLDTNLFTLSKIDENLAQRCVAYQQSQLPEYKKEGTAQPLTITFGYEVNGENFIPSLYQGQFYSLPVTLSNVDTTEDLTGVIVKGYVQNDTCYSGTDCINMKATGACSEENPCTIPAGKSLSANLQGDAVIADKPGAFVEIKIEVSHVAVAYGKGELTVVRSLQALQTVPLTQPESKTGPVDVVIYFAPDYFLSTGSPQNQQQTVQELMYVAVSNSGKGIGKIGNILIDRIGTFSDLEKVQCKIPWSSKELQTINEGETYDLKNIVIPKGSNIQFMCNLKIDTEVARALLNNFKDAYKGIPFTTTVGYQYFDTATFNPPKPVQKLG